MCRLHVVHVHAHVMENGGVGDLDHECAECMNCDLPPSPVSVRSGCFYAEGTNLERKWLPESLMSIDNEVRARKKVKKTCMRLAHSYHYNTHLA